MRTGVCSLVRQPHMLTIIKGTYTTQAKHLNFPLRRLCNTLETLLIAKHFTQLEAIYRSSST